MALLALGINHATASLGLRERLAIPPEATPRALESLRASGPVAAAAILSTCNRTEVYVDHDGEGEAATCAWLSEFQGVRLSELTPTLYRHSDADAVRHVFRVATGLDSLIVGEPQILGQLKEAYRLAHAARSLSGPLDQMLQRAFAAAKDVRTETQVGAGAVSVAYAAVRLAGQVFDQMDQRSALLIGAGETLQLTARHLVSAGVKRIVVANRTLDRARALASRVGGVAVRLSDIDMHLVDCDVLIAAVQVDTALIDAARVRRAMKARRYRPLFAVDLGVPRNVDPAVGEVSDVYLYTVDDLRAVVDEGLNERRHAARQAEHLIDVHVSAFMGWWRERAAGEAISVMRQRADVARADVLAKAQRRLAAGESPEAVLEFLSHTLTNRLLHRPTVGLRSAAALGDSEFLEMASRLLSLEPAESKSD